ncbi:MAG: DMT family transporter, partial [Clostridia bacterium]|nr:DMT family transporter [Clostridia bacterium]
PLSVDMLPELLFLAVFASAFALLFQHFGIKHCSPSTSSIILALESVFGIIFSLIAGMEKDVTLRQWIGFAVVFIAVIVSETKLSFLRGKKTVKPETSEGKEQSDE